MTEPAQQTCTFWDLILSAPVFIHSFCACDHPNLQSMAEYRRLAEPHPQWVDVSHALPDR